MNETTELSNWIFVSLLPPTTHGEIIKSFIKNELLRKTLALPCAYVWIGYVLKLPSDIFCEL